MPHARRPAHTTFTSAAAWRGLALATACAVSACAYLPTPRPAAGQGPVGAPAGAVSVTYDDPARFSDAREGSRETAKARRAWLDVLAGHITERTAAVLPVGQRLDVRLTDIKRAGGFEPWRGPQAADVRIVRDVYPPRIDLDFKRLDADGRVLQSGSRQLRDVAFQMRATAYANDPLRFEKVLVDDWVAKEFGTRR